MIGGAGVGACPLAGLILGTRYPLTDFVDPIATRNQRQIQPYAYLELYEIETLGYGTLRYVDFQHPDAPGALPDKLEFDGDEYSARKIERGEIKKSDEIAQFPVTITDVRRELVTAVDDENEVGLNERRVRIHRIPYDLLDRPELAVTEEYRVQTAVANLGPDRVSVTIGLPSLESIQVPVKTVSRNRCWNEYPDRFNTANFCRYPSDDFEEGTAQVFGRDTAFVAKPTSWPRFATKRKFGWSSVNADIASLWQSSDTVSPSTGIERWTSMQSDDPNQKWGAQSAIDQAATQDGALFVDVTDDMNDPLTTTAAFPAVPVAFFDSMIFGVRNRQIKLTVDVATAGAGTYTGIWQFWNGSMYEALSNVTDGTNLFKTAGVNDVTFDLPPTWAQSGVEQIFPLRLVYSGGTMTTVPLLRQAWSEPARAGMFMWKDLDGPFDVSTHLENLGAREERLIGLMFADPDSDDWLIWGQAENSSQVEVLRRRSYFAGVQSDEDFTPTDGNERFRCARVDDTFSLYARLSDTGAWVLKDTVTWTGAPQALRLGLVVSSDKYELATLVGARFRHFHFASGGFPDCNRSRDDCALRENLHQFNGFPRITKQTTRG